MSKFSNSKPLSAPVKNRKSKDFLDSREMLAEVILSKKQKKCTNRLIEMFYLLSERIHRKFWFEGVDMDFLNEKVHVSATKCWEVYDKFDETKSQYPHSACFGFFTQVIKNQSYATEKIQSKWMKCFTDREKGMMNHGEYRTSKDLFEYIDYTNEDGYSDSYKY